MPGLEVSNLLVHTADSYEFVRVVVRLAICRRLGIVVPSMFHRWWWFRLRLQVLLFLFDATQAIDGQAFQFLQGFMENSSFFESVGSVPQKNVLPTRFQFPFLALGPPEQRAIPGVPARFDWGLLKEILGLFRSVLVRVVGREFEHANLHHVRFLGTGDLGGTIGFEREFHVLLRFFRPYTPSPAILQFFLERIRHQGKTLASVLVQKAHGSSIRFFWLGRERRPTVLQRTVEALLVALELVPRHQSTKERIEKQFAFGKDTALLQAVVELGAAGLPLEHLMR
mmetsp:Transcript_2189/g.5816  ORF Transcript_2189/g.5816 Transcript_2189/m.5816 type:complete len:283 (-) Transcript_2189:459-1307(-)